MKRIVFLIWSAALVSGCVFYEEELPVGQSIFNSAVEQLYDDYLESAANRRNRAKIENDIIDLLKDNDHQAIDWVAEVELVSRKNGKIVITARSSPSTYELVIDSKFELYLSDLEQGDDIIFSGLLGKERSSNLAKSIEVPEFRFVPSSLIVAKSGFFITQD